MGFCWNTKRRLWMRERLFWHAHYAVLDIPEKEVFSVRFFGWMGPRFFFGFIVQRSDTQGGEG